MHQVSRYFTYILFSIALVTAFYWGPKDGARAWNAVTSILIVACPCALLLSSTFTNGNMLAKLQGFRFYIRNAKVLEELSAADTIVFDKTGTLSVQAGAKITFEKGVLSDYEKRLLRSLASQSNHPLSKAILSYLPVSDKIPIKNYQEEKGKGSCGELEGQFVKIGSCEYVCGQADDTPAEGSRVYVSVNHELIGHFVIRSQYREGLESLITKLKPHYKLSLLSGDNQSEKQKLQAIFGPEAEMLFEQRPQEKLNYIEQLQKQGRKVIMIGDGLNDAGALRQSDAGIAITDDINNFSPGCDGILDGKIFKQLAELLAYCKKEKTIIYGSFIISIMYNIVGIYFAVQGHLSPVIAAILMPISSISIVSYTTILSNLYFTKLKR